jgi:hypothetical protein
VPEGNPSDLIGEFQKSLKLSCSQITFLDSAIKTPVELFPENTR